MPCRTPIPITTCSARDTDCARESARFLRESIEHGTNREIAAIIVEPVQGRGGNVVPPPGFLAEVQKVAREVGALLIVDEMITGFYRTGKPFAFMHDEGVEPDILVMGKGFGNGYPISGIAARETSPDRCPGQSPAATARVTAATRLACAAALANAPRAARRVAWRPRRSRLASSCSSACAEWRWTPPIVGDVRGKGLLLGC